MPTHCPPLLEALQDDAKAVRTETIATLGKFSWLARLQNMLTYINQKRVQAYCKHACIVQQTPLWVSKQHNQLYCIVGEKIHQLPITEVQYTILSKIGSEVATSKGTHCLIV